MWQFLGYPTARVSPNGDLQEAHSGLPSAKKIPYLIDIDWSENIAIYVRTGGWTGEKKMQWL